MTAYYNEFDPKAAAWLRECYSTYIGGRIYQSVYGECIMTTDYETYRGRCKELCEMALLEKPELIMVRGFYHCPMWGKQEHWWLKDSDGNIVDPSVKQFPTKGIAAEYEEFDGICECAECGTEKPEEEMKFESNYAFCSNKCLMRFVGL